ncbi:hypothetical protein MBLNU457_4206t1 [Dothideomycetes sp. NU457]
MVATDHERDLVVELVSVDDRPSFILREKPAADSGSDDAEIVFANQALEVFIQQSPEDFRSFENWALRILENYPPSTQVAKPRQVGIFAGQEWSSNNLKCDLTLVYCRKLNWSPRLQDEQAQASYNTGHDASDVSSEMPLTSLPVDWIQQPELPSDPWLLYLRNFDWTKTTLGPMHTWPFGLRARVVTIMACQEPRFILWGEDMLMMYNEAVSQMLVHFHPASMGMPLATIWGADVANQHRQNIRKSLKAGKSVSIKAAEFLVERRGYLEETYFDAEYVPLMTPEGFWSGAILEHTEVTPMIYRDNREKVLLAITDHAAKTESMAELWSGCMDALEAQSQDVVYALVYSLDHADTESGDGLPSPSQSGYCRRGWFGLDHEPSETLSQTLGASFDQAKRTIVLLRDALDTLPAELAITVSRGPVSSAYIVPVASTIGAPVAYVVLGMNPRRPLEQGMVFAKSLQDLLERCVAQIRLPEDRNRLEKANLMLLDQLRSSKLKLQQNEEAIARMGENAPAGMFIFGADSRPLYANQAYFDLFGLNKEDFYQFSPDNFVWGKALYEEDHQSAKDILVKVFLDKQAATCEYRLVSPPGAIQRWMEGIIFPELDEKGEITSFQGWVSDITHRKNLELIKEERLNEALENKRAAEKFLDMISHEIRNPLSSILLLADEILALLPENSAKRLESEVSAIREAATTITLCATHQKNVVDDVLTLSKLDSRLFNLDYENVQARAIVDSGLSIMTPALKDADIKSEVKILPCCTDLGVSHVLMDSNRIKQVFINLLSNAIKFTKRSENRQITITMGASTVPPTEKMLDVALFPPRGKQPLRMDNSDSTPRLRSSEPNDVVYVWFSVKDTGCGIEEHEMQNLFHKFQQASVRTEKSYGGSGLGLFISREFVELHNGQIGMQSTPNVGSTFAFYIKAYRAETTNSSTNGVAVPCPESMHMDVALSDANLVEQCQEVPQIPPVMKVPQPPRAVDSRHLANLSDVDILVVEDNPVNQKVLAHQLRRAGCKSVGLTDNGLEALRYLETTNLHKSSRADSKPLSIILLDIEMPVMGGIACVKRIRELEQEGVLVRHIPVMAVTANARQEQKDMVIAAGMDDVTTKPFKIPELLAGIQVLVAAWEE